MGPVERLETTLGTDIDAICAAVLNDSRVLKALRGGLVEHATRNELAGYDTVTEIRRGTRGGDFDVELVDGRVIAVEAQAVDATPYADGTAKVDLRRAAPVGGERLYPVDAFDVVAICLQPLTGDWQWRYQRVDALDHRTVAGRTVIDPNCRVDNRWQASFTDVLDERVGARDDQLRLFST